MKKLTIVISFLTAASSSSACDICGCGVGGNYIGILPDFAKHVAGLRYRYNALQTHLGTGGSITYLTSLEKYQTLEFWGGWTIGKKVRLMASIPYAINERTNQGITRSKNGLADVTLSGYYQLLNKMKTTGRGKMLMQTLWLGAGIKLPAGKYTAADKQNTSQQTNLFQLGTGSTDFLMQGMYDIRLHDAGLNITASYKMNTANRYAYNYGNKLSTSAQFYYKWRIKKKLTLAPNAGIASEHAKKDIDDKVVVDLSGGRMWMGTVGTEASYEKISVGAVYQTPFSQHLANDVVKARAKLMVHMSIRL
ncbi:MAG: transporter [Bacteroidetes bacterium]|nr:transporter [Bacteroidota bacterium]